MMADRLLIAFTAAWLVFTFVRSFKKEGQW